MTRKTDCPQEIYLEIQKVDCEAKRRRKMDFVSKEEAFPSFGGVLQEIKLPIAPEYPLVLRREKDRPQTVPDSLAELPVRCAAKC